MRLAHTGLRPAASITFEFDGRPIEALEGETIAAALSAAGRVAISRRTDGTMRGLWCGMGTCFECVVSVDRKAGQRACMTKAAAGMAVNSVPSGKPPASAAEVAGGSAGRVIAEVAVIGAGPAGLTSATLLAGAGLDVVLIDDRLDLGGQYLKPVAAHYETRGPLDRQFVESTRRRLAALRSGVKIWRNATVWSAFAPDEIGVVHEGRQHIVEAKRLLLATGAYERPVPVPGWTMPGVMTTGAAQTLVRAYRVIPGRRVLIAGNGPLNFQLAAELLQAGVEVVAVVEQAAPPTARQWRTLATAVYNAPSLMASGARYLLMLHRHGVPIFWNSQIKAAEGETALRCAVVATPAGLRRFDSDVLALGYGLMPSTELARQLGCSHRFVNKHAGFLATETDRTGRTSLEQVFAVGDGADPHGAVVASARAVLAADAILRDLRPTGLPTAAVLHATRGLERAERFQRALWALFRTPFFEAQSIADATVVCRCESVTAGAIRRAMSDHGADAGTVKRTTRIGMGRCQGRNCGSVLARLIELANGAPSQSLSYFAPRPPAKPVPLAALAAEKEEWGGHRQSMPPRVFSTSERPRLNWLLRRCDVLVVGGGIVGACVARELAQRGVAALVVDRNAVGHEASTANAGSLHVQLLSFDFGEKAQAGGGPAADTLRLGPPSIVAWRQIEQQSDMPLEMQCTGGLMVAETERELAFLRDKAALEARHGIETHIVSGHELRRLEPALAPGLIAAAYCPAEGKINPLTATFAVVAEAKRAGATFEAHAGVLAIEREIGGFRVVTVAGPIQAGRIVNCAGAWAPYISAMVGKPIPVTGAPLQMMVTEPGPILVGGLLAHAGRHLSLKQTASGSLLIGGGWSAGFDEGTGFSNPLRWAIEGNAWVACRVLPAAANFHLLRVWAGMNVNIDGAPIIGEMPGVPGFYNCVSSNGYTLAPILAQLTADLMTIGKTELDIAGFTLARF